VGPGVDDLKAVGFGRNDVKFTAVGLDQHLRGLTCKVKIGDENAAAKVHDGEACFGAAHDEGDGTVGNDENFVRLWDDRDGGALLKCGGIVDAEGGGAAIYNKDEFFVRGGAGLDGLGAGFGAADDGARGDVNGQELVGGGRGGVDTIAGGREIDREGQRADGDAPGDLRSAGVKDPEIATAGAHAPDFGPLGVLAHVGDTWADRDFLDDAEIGKIKDGDGAVGGGNVGIEMQIGTEKRRAMLAEEDDNEDEEKNSENEIDTEGFEAIHGMDEFT